MLVRTTHEQHQPLADVFASSVVLDVPYKRTSATIVHKQQDYSLYECDGYREAHWPVAIMMALFGLLWLMRIRTEIRKDKRKRSKHPVLDDQLLLPPPISFADPKHSVKEQEDVLDDVIPPPPPPPLRQNVQIHRSSSSIGDGLNYPSQRLFQQAQSFSRSAQNLRINTLECTCPTGPPIRRPAVRFCDDPFGFYSARTAQSWNYSTLPRTRPTSRSSHGLPIFFPFFSRRNLIKAIPRKFL